MHVSIAVQMADAVVNRGYVLARNAFATAVLKTQEAVQQIAARKGLEFRFLPHHLNVIEDAARKISSFRQANKLLQWVHVMNCNF